MFIHVQKERIKIIDSLRGFSLLGILLANAVIYGYGLLDKSDLTNDKSKRKVTPKYTIKIDFGVAFCLR
ncbi:hypothetical protein KOY_03499 [Bacillus cereus VDM021]|uniref:Uncharacterized protein n=1 Tax=Bacillus pseudomycoides TaxID=64104 RepID=A0A1Y3M8K7_9BACI|nr:hypothetical protein IIW_01837 [Bacillus cereus VD136]EOQ06290.1 hypothetical protein KOY_03499 [Bacillus cereus VDM021]OOG94283.1 hypothetical protein BTH41_01982 [Bacillus mycoides]OUM46755.1 hypothetical protein BW425_21830 [Bacillus pseudomycoides]PEK60176.1 hypothetical protein CN590_24235 [Bacillus pseudomycoides]